MADAKENNESSRRITLGYWKICGLANTARMMLVYANVDFENVMYEAKEVKTDKGVSYDTSSWTDKKYTLGLDFPNLPYLFDTKTGAKFTESQAIYRYIARQFKIGVQSDPQMAIADNVCAVIGNANQQFVNFSYGFGGATPYPEGKDKYLNETFAAKVKPLETFMKDKKFVCGGDEISYADFLLYYYLYCNLKLEEQSLASYPNLMAFYDNFCKLEFMDRWNKSEYAKLPMNNTMAKFGGKYL